MAIVLDEPDAPACIAAIESEDEIVISAGTLAEVRIVSTGRNVGSDMSRFLDRFPLAVVPVTEATAQTIGAAYRQWGRDFHPAALNFGDCFAYALAKERGCPLLYVGHDFAKTDVASALGAI